MADSPRPPQPPDAGSSPDAQSTFQLLERAHEGDSAALDVLFSRYLRPLQHWASGRLPRWARNSADTHDLVQDTLLNAFRKIGSFEPRREGAFQAYLRQAVMNRIRDHIRRTGTRPAMSTFEESDHEHPSSPLDQVIGLETFERYEAALARLTPNEREAIIGRVELGHTYEELAATLEKPSADAARMAVARALVRLAEEMKRDA
jgi:RNA polymerase sigma-70 factor (ECF subfamily)